MSHRLSLHSSFQPMTPTRSELTPLHPHSQHPPHPCTLTPPPHLHFHFQSEYIAACDKRREFISGFTGSAGVAVVTADRALLWTDGRYHLQASTELSADWTLMKQGSHIPPTLHTLTLPLFTPSHPPTLHTPPLPLLPLHIYIYTQRQPRSAHY